MSDIRMTVFTATLVQDSALSVSGVDRESTADRPFATADRPFAFVDGKPVLSGRGLKGAVVAMARRCFKPFPLSVSGDVGRHKAFRRSLWDFSNAVPEKPVASTLQAGVGILQKTGARAEHVLYDTEVIPAGTRWSLQFAVDWSYARSEMEACEAEGILGYVLKEHWVKGRCWLGGGVARGLGWCHLEDLSCRRLNIETYEKWIAGGRKDELLPSPLPENEMPSAAPTRSWCFRTLGMKLTFGEYRPDLDQPAWGLDMLAIGSHSSEQSAQKTIDGGKWAKPSWVDGNLTVPDVIETDRSILLGGTAPLLPGSSIRGPLRHAFSRIKRNAGIPVEDPHPVQGKVAATDEAGKIFGTTEQSSRVLIRDSHAEDEWFAARLHMHAEDEFSAGTFESSKRDAVRLLLGTFPVRIVVEGGDPGEVNRLMKEIDGLVSLGKIGHLPVGGHKTRGAGWGRWEPGDWQSADVTGAQPECADGARIAEIPSTPSKEVSGNMANQEKWQKGNDAWKQYRDAEKQTLRLKIESGQCAEPNLMLSSAVAAAKGLFEKTEPVAWWCEPKIDLSITAAPATFGRGWPGNDNLQVDEVAFYAKDGVWRAARTVSGAKWVCVKETVEEDGTIPAEVVQTPARLHHDMMRFSAADTGQGEVVIREWRDGEGQTIGFTLIPEKS